jgi:hypothetical protein
MQLPVLGRVPGVGNDELVIKATSSGITLLKENCFRRRYTGNKYSAVDIQGHFWLKASELRKECILSAIRSKLRIAGGDDAVARWDGKLPDKKRGQPGKAAPVKNILTKELPVQISQILSTGLSTEIPQLSPKRTYRVNKREVRQRILAMLNTQAGKKQMYFWTISFFEKTPDDLAYRMFNIWLTSLRQYGLLHDYIWVAERQENGTVHFHITIPHKMPVQRANAMMRGTLKTFAKRGDLNESVYRCNRYNGVDIAKNRKTKRTVNFAIKKGSRALAAYLTKYVTKNDTEFSHLAWHNSRGYSSLFTGVTFTIKEFINNGWPALLNRAKKFTAEFFTFVPWSGDPPAALMGHLFQLNSHIQSLLN